VCPFYHLDEGGTLAVAQARVPSGLPAREAPPRTLEAFWPVFVGFVLSWLGIVAYLLTFGRRLTRNSEVLAPLLRSRPE